MEMTEEWRQRMRDCMFAREKKREREREREREKNREREGDRYVTNICV